MQILNLLTKQTPEIERKPKAMVFTPPPTAKPKSKFLTNAEKYKWKV